jgi:hypothetical protein
MGKPSGLAKEQRRALDRLKGWCRMAYTCPEAPSPRKAPIEKEYRRKRSPG